jgi:hypothetical protein
LWTDAPLGSTGFRPPCGYLRRAPGESTGSAATLDPPPLGPGLLHALRDLSPLLAVNLRRDRLLSALPAVAALSSAPSAGAPYGTHFPSCLATRLDTAPTWRVDVADLPEDP